MNPQHPFTHAATSSFTNYPSQQSLMNRNSMNNTPVSSSYQYQNTSSVADLNLQIPIQHYNSQSSNNNNNIYSNNNLQSNSTGFDYNSPPLKSHMHTSAGGSNNSYFQNSQYNFSQPQQSMHNYHHYGVTGNYQPSSHNVNNSSSFNIHPSQDLSSFKQHQQQETLSSKQSMNSQSPSNQNTVVPPHNYFSTTSVTTQNSKQPLDNSPKQHSVNQQKPTDSVTSSYQTPSNSFTPTPSAELSKTKSPAKTPTNSTESNDDSASDEESTNSPNARRGKKSTRACEACRRHHRKCDGGNPCQTCSGKGIGCVYTERKKRGPKNEATKILKREVEELKEKLTINEKIKGEWEQKCKELAKILGVSITLNDQNIPVFGNIPEFNQANNTSNAQLISQCNDQCYTPVVFDSSGAIDTSNPLSTIPVFSISLSNEEENNKKRKKIEENLDNPKKQKLDKSCSTEIIETLDLTQARDSSIPMDGQRFALSTMVTRFINIWDKYVHPFHSLLPVKWQSAMPDLLYDIIRNDGVHSENTFFMYSLICNSARSLGDIMLSRELHHKAMSLYPHHVNNPDPRVGFGLVLLSYYSMSVGNLRKAISYCKDALRISESLEKPQLNLQMNVFLSIASISDDYQERRVNFKRLGQTKQICDVIMSVTGEVQNEITHGGNTNYKDLIAQMADLLRLKNMSSSNVTLMHEIAIYGILILCLHKAGYRDLALNYGRKLLEISKDSNFKHCCIGTSSSAIAQAATMFLDFEGYPEFYECMSIMDELSMRYELAGLMKKNVEERFVLMSNHLSSGGSSSGSSNDNSPNMAPFL